MEKHHVEGYCRDDHSSHSNTHQVRVTQYDVRLWPSLKKRTLKAQVKYHLHVLADTSLLYMDVYGFDSIQVVQNGHECRHEVSQITDIGSRLTIHLAEALHKGQDSTLEITSVTSNAKSLTWGDFVFTQNEPIYCRSLFPCQDTPSSKSTFDIDIHLDEEDNKLSVYATGLRQGTTNRFLLDIPIPTYLFAFLIGNFEQRKLNHRIGVVAEPSEIEACVKELDQLQEYVNTLQKLMFPYEWKEYNICILPRSFPYGGMENPIFTFASPSIITGDKSGTSVAVHEIAHSWTGNLISCRNWQNFWMNEGFTVYFENAALKAIHGEEFYQANSILAQTSVLKTIKDDFGVDHPYTALEPKLGHANPDDAFSNIPYNKGYIFLSYLEQLVGGSKVFLQLVNGFLKKHARKSVEWHQFRSQFNHYVHEHGIKLSEEVDWELWIQKPGYPPRLDLFKSSKIEEVIQLASIIESNTDKFEQELNKLLTDKNFLNIHLTEVLFHHCRSKPVSHDTLKRLDQRFSLSTSLQNFELMLEWYLLCLKNRYMEIVNIIDSRLLERIGRMKFIRPIYKELKNCDAALAKSVFERNKQYYSAIAIDLIAKDLAKP